MLGLALIVVWRIRQSHEKDNEALIRLSNYDPPRTTPTESAVHILSSETIKLWLLVWRASSESFLGRQTIPEGKEVLTRRTILEKLQTFGLRDQLTDKERDLHLLPDGEWSKEAILENIFRIAELEALQYACGAINTLSPIEDFDQIRAVETEPIRSAAKDITWQPRETIDIRQEMNMAAFFYLRCLGEQAQRGIVANEFNEEEGVIIRDATANAGDHNRDLVIGTKIITEVENDKLNLAAGQAYMRFKTLRRAIFVLEFRTPPTPHPTAQSASGSV